VHWCGRRVRFNEVPETVPKVPEKVWEALVQSLQVTFNRVQEKVPEKSGEGLGGFGAEPDQVQQGSGCHHFHSDSKALSDESGCIQVQFATAQSTGL